MTGEIVVIHVTSLTNI